MKKVLISVVITLILGGLIVAGCAAPAPAPKTGPAPAPALAPAAQPIVLKALTAYPISQTTGTRAVGLIADAVKQKSNGQLQINWIGGPEAIAAADQPTALRNGAIDFLCTPFSYYEKLIPQITVGNLSQYTAAEQQTKGIFDYWNKLHEAQLNAHFFGFANFGGGYYLYMNREIKNPKTDFQGLKIRSGVIYDGFLKALGAVPVTLSAEDVYNSLQTKVVDGAGWLPEQFNSNKAYEVCKYFINHPFYGTALAEMMNLDRWKALPKNLQDILATAANEVNKSENAWFFDQQDVLKKKFIGLGVTATTFSDQDAAWFIKLAYDTKWNEAKTKLSAEDWDALYKMLNK